MSLFRPSLIVLAFSLLSANAFDKARYDNYRVYRFVVENNQQENLMKEIEDNPDGYKFVSGSTRVGDDVQLIVPPHKFGEFYELEKAFDLKSDMLTSNLQDDIDKETFASNRRKASFDWVSYWTLDEINEWMNSLVEQNPDDISLFTVGVSYEGREIRGIRINIGGGEKSSIFFESLIHSYEWIAGATTTWIMNELLTSSDPKIQFLASRYEWYFVPVFNVDGYAYTWTTDRMWRKSRQPTKNILCNGADLNRNWDVHFGDSSPQNPCHTRYGGAAAFSEPESQQLSQFLAGIPRLVGYFSIHALGQYLMFPYAYTTDRIETYDILHEIGLKGSKALTGKHGKVYEFGALNEFFDPLSGTSLDWVSINLKPNVTFTYELRPTRAEENLTSTGLLLPTEQIVEVAEEVFASIVAILQAAIEKDFA